MPVSVSLKSTGDRFVTPDVTNLSPQEKAKLVLKRRNVDGMFGQSPIYAIVDSRLSDRSHRLLTLMAARRVTDPAITMTYPEMAIALNCSDRKAKRCTKELERLGWITVCRRHNRANSYTLCGQFVEPSTKSKRKLSPCSKCGMDCVPNGKTGWCRPCVSNAREDKRRAGMEAIKRAKIAI